MNEIAEKTNYWLNTTAVSVRQYFFFSSLVLIVIFAWMEPVGTAGMSFGKGLIFWTIQISILMPLLIYIQHFASHYVTLKSSQTAWIQTALSGVITSLLFVPVAYFLDTLFAIPEDETSISLLHGLLDEALGVVLPVTVTWLALNAPWILQLDFSKKDSELTNQKINPQAQPRELSEQPSRFLQELRNRASGELISISSELHYVRVVTTEAEIMFLYNLKDAIGELPANAGMQIHRSHWVSKSHIKGLSKRNGNAECTLSNGKKLPVSRRKYSEVKDLLNF